ncbi:hypothetical protein DIPPA_06383 [Diplonema papillatum]|nr:hypothetical protein DIPPA_06383 [Diplonema papillatum]
MDAAGASLKIQCCARQRRARRRVDKRRRARAAAVQGDRQHDAASCVQSAWRRRAARLDAGARAKQQTALVIQCWYRRCAAARLVARLQGERARQCVWEYETRAAEAVQGFYRARRAGRPNSTAASSRAPAGVAAGELTSRGSGEHHAPGPARALSVTVPSSRTVCAAGTPPVFRESDGNEPPNVVNSVSTTAPPSLAFARLRESGGNKPSNVTYSVPTTIRPSLVFAHAPPLSGDGESPREAGGNEPPNAARSVSSTVPASHVFDCSPSLSGDSELADVRCSASTHGEPATERSAADGLRTGSLAIIQSGGRGQIARQALRRQRLKQRLRSILLIQKAARGASGRCTAGDLLKAQSRRHAGARDKARGEFNANSFPGNNDAAAMEVASALTRGGAKTPLPSEHVLQRHAGAREFNANSVLGDNESAAIEIATALACGGAKAPLPSGFVLHRHAGAGDKARGEFNASSFPGNGASSTAAGSWAGPPKLANEGRPPRRSSAEPLRAADLARPRADGGHRHRIHSCSSGAASVSQSARRGSRSHAPNTGRGTSGEAAPVDATAGAAQDMLLPETRRLEPTISPKSQRGDAHPPRSEAGHARSRAAAACGKRGSEPAAGPNAPQAARCGTQEAAARAAPPCRESGLASGVSASSQEAAGEQAPRAEPPHTLGGCLLRAAGPDWRRLELTISPKSASSQEAVGDQAPRAEPPHTPGRCLLRAAGPDLRRLELTISPKSASSQEAVGDQAPRAEPPHTPGRCLPRAAVPDLRRLELTICHMPHRTPHHCGREEAAAHAELPFGEGGLAFGVSASSQEAVAPRAEPPHTSGRCLPRAAVPDLRRLELTISPKSASSQGAVAGQAPGAEPPATPGRCLPRAAAPELRRLEPTISPKAQRTPPHRSARGEAAQGARLPRAAALPSPEKRFSEPEEAVARAECVRCDESGLVSGVSTSITNEHEPKQKFFDEVSERAKLRLKQMVLKHQTGSNAVGPYDSYLGEHSEKNQAVVEKRRVARVVDVAAPPSCGGPQLPPAEQRRVVKGVKGTCILRHSRPAAAPTAAPDGGGANLLGQTSWRRHLRTRQHALLSSHPQPQPAPARAGPAGLAPHPPPRQPAAPPSVGAAHAASPRRSCFLPPLATRT